MTIENRCNYTKIDATGTPPAVATEFPANPHKVPSTQISLPFSATHWGGVSLVYNGRELNWPRAMACSRRKQPRQLSRLQGCESDTRESEKRTAATGRGGNRSTAMS